ncbi:MAG: hypothetical protein SFX19_09975 [Alphaproteobacteria bacterium]|nr:hypothetical protein [Alphaproteobacteria bacterium]
MTNALVIGRDVPWNAAWTGEDRFELRPCRWANGKLAVWQPTSPGNGKPMFADPHMVRQRMSVMRMICTVCGQRTTPGDRWMFAMGEYIKHLGAKFWVTTEAPVHKACAELAGARCPHIRKLGIQPQPFPAGHMVMAALVGGEQFEKDFGIKVPAGQQIIGHLKIAFPATIIRERAA